MRNIKRMPEYIALTLHVEEKGGSNQKSGKEEGICTQEDFLEVETGLRNAETTKKPPPQGRKTSNRSREFSDRRTKTSSSPPTDRKRPGGDAPREEG